jgi:hypothetical protein
VVGASKLTIISRLARCRDGDLCMERPKQRLNRERVGRSKRINFKVELNCTPATSFGDCVRYLTVGVCSFHRYSSVPVRYNEII